MFAYVVRRLFSGVVMLLVMSFVTILLFFSAPVDPARQMCGKSCTPERIEQTRKALGYDKPPTTQWAAFVKGVVVGRDYPADEQMRKEAPQNVVHCSAPCLGYSTVSQQMVASAVGSHVPVSASLALCAFVMWIIAGVVLGVIAALFKGTVLDRTIVGASLLFYAFPTFALALGIYTFFALTPFPGLGHPLFPIPNYTPISQGGVWTWFVNLLLPAFTLALVFIAGYVRITRSFVLESGQEDYIRTAKAKGLESRRILLKHTMRAALTPIVTIAGLDLGGLLGGAIITEKIFNYPGLGKLAFDSTVNYDLPIIVGIVLVAASFVIVANLVVDILYAVIDPRVKYS
ncbi:Binding-protein-dependent transport systems inner membrane component [Nostocoides japonicum T1-X7]|uniref:Binding-protein-dependent transport systems inner membrane component n=2 Tax=Nostocoides japonicum TaxID=99481 RepID=A0A077LZI3_9MICO|nr:Binding-protein-dependent transport systems inner membrane component [Tetrasphaera japonica T1-X7]